MSNVIRFPLGSTLRHNLAEAQERKAAQQPLSFVYRIYTEDKPGVEFWPLIRRYFDGATLTVGTGLWLSQVERSLVIEIVTETDRLQDIVFLAGDIKERAQQSAVLVTWHRVHSLLV